MDIIAKLKLRAFRILGLIRGRLDFPGTPITLRLHGATDVQRLSSCRKEPETVAWLESHVKADSVLYDIGANVGAYSLIAAKIASARVVAFEPSFSTFATLSENILDNGVEGSVTPVHIALASVPGFLSLAFSSVESGAAKHTVNTEGKGAAVPTLKVAAMPLDDLRTTLGLPEPTLVKIDVDGGEWDVLQGMKKTLSLPSLRSVLIEIDQTEGHADEMLVLLASSGFTVAEKHPRGKGKSTTLFNYIFERK